MNTMKKRIIFITKLVLVSVFAVISIWIIIKIGYDAMINNTSKTDILIAIAHDGGAIYRFILSEDGKLTVAYGRKKFSNNEDEWGNIVSRKFMNELFIEESVWLPDDVYAEIRFLINEFINSGATDEIIASADAWHFVVLTTDEIYRASHKNPQSMEIGYDVLIPLLSEWSPIVVELRHSGFECIPERK